MLDENPATFETQATLILLKEPNMEERFIDLEMRISHQEDMIDELNKTIYRQQNKIDQLEAALFALAGRMAESTNNSMMLTHEKPPHY